MKILRERVYKVGYKMDYFRDHHEIKSISMYSDAVKYDAEPTTDEEVSILADGHCPKCGDSLAGDQGNFCIRDQTYWNFQLGKPVV